MLARLVLAVATMLAANLSLAIGNLENPQPISVQTGVAAISGWHCGATLIQIQIDSGALVAAPYGSLRADTQATCGRSNTGFAYLLNYNTLPVGTHTIRVFADGVQFASTTFSTTKPAGEFLSGVNAGYWLNNFPEYGQRSRVDWSEAKQNFSITATDANYIRVGGTYYGAAVYVRSGCTATSGNGAFYQYGRFTVAYPSNLTITADYENSGTCTYVGNPTVMADGTLSMVSGTFTCTNGERGVWSSSRMVTAPDGLSANISVRFTVGETCHLDGTVGGARWK